jgi:transcription initiation factor TFIIIB Brf1 subunit/transcription initiation factor TFIIB
MIKNIREVDECPECGSVNIIRNEKLQQVICKDCGMIFEPMIPGREEQFEKAAKFRREL